MKSQDLFSLKKKKIYIYNLECRLLQVFLGALRVKSYHKYLDSFFVCVEVLRPSRPNGVMSSAVSLPNHTFTGQS